VRHGGPQAHRGNPGAAAGVEKDADDPRRALVAGELEPELVDELRIRRRAGDRRRPRVRHVGDECAQRHRELDSEIGSEVRDDLGEAAPPVVRLDADEKDGVAASARDTRAEECVLRPLDLSRSPLLERDHRPRRLEVHEQLRVDVRELPRAPEPRQVSGGEGRCLSAVVPSAKGADQHRPL
jgi:hypothetical protein